MGGRRYLSATAQAAEKKNGVPGSFPLGQAEELTGISQQQVSKWATALSDGQPCLWNALKRGRCRDIGPEPDLGLPLIPFALRWGQIGGTADVEAAIGRRRMSGCGFGAGRPNSTRRAMA